MSLDEIIEKLATLRDAIKHAGNYEVKYVLESFELPITMIEIDLQERKVKLYEE